MSTAVNGKSTRIFRAGGVSSSTRIAGIGYWSGKGIVVARPDYPHRQETQ